MRIPARVFVVDLDDTLIDNEKVKVAIDSNLAKLSGTKVHTQLLRQTYSDVREDKGFVDYAEISRRIGKILSLDPKAVLTCFYNVSYKKYLFPFAPELIKYLQTLGKVILFSQGELALQSHKINKSGIERLIGLDNVKIIQSKKEGVNQLIQELHKQGFKSITFIEDRADILDEAYRLDKSVICYWLRSGRHRDDLPKTSCVNFQSNSIEEIYKFIYFDNTIAKIKPKTGEELSLKIGITPTQVGQLITFTHQDKLVQQFTQDLDRFKDKSNFYTWLNQGKSIYTLVDVRDNLCGLIWFSTKLAPIGNYNLTVAIRVYGQMRGQGLSKKFLQIAIQHFSPDGSLWVIIDWDNTASIKLHKAFGFKVVTKDQNQDKIVLVYE